MAERSVLMLTLTEGPRAGTVLATEHDSELIGRSPKTASMVIKDAAVSERHAELTWSQGGWWLRDVGSSNGTTVNGVVLERGEPLLGGGRPVRLKEGDLLRIGEVSLATVAISPGDLDSLTVEASLQLESENLQDAARAHGERLRSQLLRDWQECKSRLLEAAE